MGGFNRQEGGGNKENKKIRLLTSAATGRWQDMGCRKDLFFLLLRVKSSATVMNPSHSLLGTPNRRIAAIALVVLALDQFTKSLVLRLLPNAWRDEKTVVNGFFKFVHWQNTGAAWSSFNEKNGLLALIAIVALVILYFSRNHFNSHTLLGQFAFGLVIGGIMGNLVDRIFRQHVVDFLRFYIERRGAPEIGFPAFNVADSAICVGVTLVFLMTWRHEHAPKPVESASE
jgi:signal peptidase II